MSPYPPSPPGNKNFDRRVQGAVEALKSSKIARRIKENHVTPLNLPVAPVNPWDGRVQDWVIVLRTNPGNNAQARW
jgi:hypothetical protein